MSRSSRRPPAPLLAPSSAPQDVASLTLSANERRVLQLVRLGQASTRAEITQATGLAAQSISRIVDALAARGLLTFGERIVQGRGQPGVKLELNRSAAHAVGLSINRQGVVQASMADGTAPQDLGALEMARFVNPAGLEAIGDNAFLETPASGIANRGLPGQVGFGTVMQNFLEASNVNAVTEISALITAQRAYEMNSKVITTTDEMLRSTTNLR